MKEYFVPEFLPPYTSELNGPIETVWSILKRKGISQITKLLIRKTCTKRMCIKAIEKEIRKIERETFLNLLRAHYDDIQKLIEKIDTDYNMPMPGK